MPSSTLEGKNAEKPKKVVLLLRGLNYKKVDQQATWGWSRMIQFYAAPNHY